MPIRRVAALHRLKAQHGGRTVAAEIDRLLGYLDRLHLGLDRRTFDAAIAVLLEECRHDLRRQRAVRVAGDAIDPAGDRRLVVLEARERVLQEVYDQVCRAGQEPAQVLALADQ